MPRNEVVYEAHIDRTVRHPNRNVAATATAHETISDEQRVVDDTSASTTYANRCDIGVQEPVRDDRVVRQ